MPTFPKPDDIPKFIRGSVSSVFQKATAREPEGANIPVPNPVVSTRNAPSTSKVEDPPIDVFTQRRKRKKHKAKKNPEQDVSDRAEIQAGHVRRDVFDARNMPLEGQPALEKYIVPEEASPAEALPAVPGQPDPEENPPSAEPENKWAPLEDSATTARRFHPARSLFEMAFSPDEADTESRGGGWVDVRRDEGNEEWVSVHRAEGEEEEEKWQR
ncbi:hypothetical protein MMC30_006938 [Trapelia coarctata]|nr:hypothetical protein [Trapelia coarctata]